MLSYVLESSSIDMNARNRATIAMSHLNIGLKKPLRMLSLASCSAFRVGCRMTMLLECLFRYVMDLASRDGQAAPPRTCRAALLTELFQGF